MCIFGAYFGSVCIWIDLPVNWFKNIQHVYFVCANTYIHKYTSAQNQNSTSTCSHKIHCKYTIIKNTSLKNSNLHKMKKNNRSRHSFAEIFSHISLLYIPTSYYNFILYFHTTNLTHSTLSSIPINTYRYTLANNTECAFLKYGAPPMKRERKLCFAS